MTPLRILIGLLLAFFSFTLFWYGGTITWHADTLISPEVSATTTDQILLEKIRKLPLEKKIGQLMIFGFASTTPDEHIRQLITEYGVGGVNVLKRNVVDARQVTELTTALQHLTESAGLPPMFIGVDQEGAVNRFAFLDEYTSQQRITEASNAYTVAKKRGEELASLGVNMNFSPVLDYVPDIKAYLHKRTFATTTDAGAMLGIAMAEGYKAGGVIPVFKHFPGYGGITVDPHKKQAALTKNTLLDESLYVFKRVLETKPDIPVMTAHIIYPEIDALPATLSKKFLTDMLRDSWQYPGVIITDDLEMVSAGQEDFREIAIETLEAGADMLISTYTTSRHEPIIKAIVASVVSGRLSEERINQSVLRAWKLKEKIN